MRDSDTLSGTSPGVAIMNATVAALPGRGATTVQAAVDAFLSSPRCTNPNTRRSYAGVLDRVLVDLGPDRPLATVGGDELADLLERLWGQRAPATWNRNRAAVAGWLVWCARNRLPAPGLPAGCERRRESVDATRAVSRSAIERALSRRDVPLREKTLWRLLYESAARASEILALNIEDLDLDARRAPIRSKGGNTEWIFWGSGTARLLPRLLRGRQAGPVFLSERRPGPTRRPAAADLCPTTNRARLGYDRARILFGQYTGWELHQLRHSAATHLGDKGVPLQLIMAKTRHRNPRTVMRYVKPGAEAVAEATQLLEPPKRRG
jgi:integrase